MEAMDQLSQPHTITEDSSDRSESSTMSQESQSCGYEGYEITRRLNLSVGRGRNVPRDELLQSASIKSKDYHMSVDATGTNKQDQQSSVLQYDEVHENSRDLSANVGKSKELNFVTSQIGDFLNYPVERTLSGIEATNELSSSQITRISKDPNGKDTFFNFSRDTRQKYLNASFDRPQKELNYLVERKIKEYDLAKSYNLPFDTMKEFKLPLERMRDNHIVGLTRERFNNTRIIDGADIQNLNIQTRNSQDMETITYERMRRTHHHLLNQVDFTAQNLVNTQLPRHTSVGQLQQSQQQQQQQIKSFTIDAILAHRNQRERHQRSQQQQLRKAARQECQEVTTKSGTSCSGNSGNGGGGSGSAGGGGGSGGAGKAKRVRTIFTAEQLERLESEFARQQYMVGPERLYLAHALRLTEAQVKVWFQNRRIKWRKVNHEQQCLAVNEHRQRCSLPSLDLNEDESDDTNGKWSNNSAITPTTTTTSPTTPVIITDNAVVQQNASPHLRELRELRSSSLVKP